jgi:hypothetical protein
MNSVICRLHAAVLKVVFVATLWARQHFVSPVQAGHDSAIIRC